MRKIVLVSLFQLIVFAGFAQELMNKLEDADVVQLIGMPAMVTLYDSSKLVGTVDKAFLQKGLMTNVSLKLQDGSEVKLKPSEIKTIKVRCKAPTMFTLVDSVGNPIKKVYFTQFVFEHPFEGKPELRQVLNPVFDSIIKIYADPSASEGGAINIKGVALQNSRLAAYILIKGQEVFYVKERSYSARDFVKIFRDCPDLISRVPKEERIFSGIGNHVLLFDHYCGIQK